MHPAYVALLEVTSHMVHGCMVNTENAEAAAVSCGTSHVTTKQLVSTPLLWIFQVGHKKLIIHLESHTMKAQ